MSVKKSSLFEIRIRIKSYNLNSLKGSKRKFQLFALLHNFKFSSINLPIKKKKFTLLKSPHVNKKARDQYEVSLSNCLIILRGSRSTWNLYKHLQKIESEDASVKIAVSNLVY